MMRFFFLKTGMVVFLLLLSSIAFAQIIDEAGAARETYISDLKLYPAIATLAERGINLAYVQKGASPGNGRYYCGGLDGAQVGKAAEIVAAAVKKLPVEAWRKIGLKYILLCSRVKASGRIIGGIPVPPLKLLMLASGDNPGWDSRFPYTVLHELYHLIEAQNKNGNDRLWNARFSGYDQSYNGGNTGTHLGSGGMGFVNGYGKTFAREERAELFAIHILAGPDLQNYITEHNDTVLQDKLKMFLDTCHDLLSAPCGAGIP